MLFGMAFVVVADVVGVVVNLVFLKKCGDTEAPILEDDNSELFWENDTFCLFLVGTLKGVWGLFFDLGSRLLVLYPWTRE